MYVGGRERRIVKKILWVSRHSPFGVRRQIETLHTMLGDDCEVVHRDIGNAESVAAEYWRGGYADIVCVVPLATLDHICRQGLRPLWAEMSETAPDDGRTQDLEFRGKRYWFAGYRRVKGVGLVTESPGERYKDEPDLARHVRVYRMTQHSLHEDEWAEVCHALGAKSVEVVEDRRAFRDARQVLDRFHVSGCDELLLVAPYSLLSELTTQGVHPIRVQMRGEQCDRVERVVGVRFEFELTPSAIASQCPLPATCPYCEQETAAESFALCATCNKPGCFLCLASYVNGQQREITRWHILCRRPRTR